MSPQSPLRFDGRTSSHPSRRGPILVILVLLFTGVGLLKAQIPDTAAARRHIYDRHLDTTFAVGAYKGSEVEGGTLADLWTFADALGLTLLRVNFGSDGAAAAAMASSTLRGTKRLVASTDLATLAGFGVEAQFYPFDSAQSPYSVQRFLTLAQGVSDTNMTERDGTSANNPLRQTKYQVGVDAAGLIAGDIVFGWNSAQTYRFPGPADSTQNASAILDQYFNPYAGRTGNAHAGKTWYITATGHLFYPTSSLSNDSTVLMIQVLYEVPKGKAYVSELLPIIKYLINPYDTSITGPIERAYAPTPVIFREAFVTEGEMRTSADSLAALEGFIVRDTTQDLTFVYDTLYVTKGDLLKLDGQDDDAYREKSLPINLERCDTCRPGPLFPGQESRRINLKVYWTGGENLALRSISIRDSLGELVLGNDPAFRDAITDEFEAAMPRDGNGAPAEGIVSMVVGNEPSDYEYGGYNRVFRMLKEGFHVGDEEGDSLQAWTEGVRYGWRKVLDNRHHLVDAGIVSVEIGLNAYIRDTVERDSNQNPVQPDNFGRRWPKIPSIAEQNGGRFTIPLMQLTEDDVRDYEQSLQTTVGHFLPEGYYDPHNDVWNQSWACALGKGAITARRTGRRPLAIPFVAVWSEVRTYIDEFDVQHDDYFLPHVPTGPELNLMASMSLAYGYRSLFWYWLGAQTGEAFDADIDGHDGRLFWSDFGSNGPHTNDTLRDWAPVFRFQDTRDEHDTTSVWIDSMYLGFRARTRELRALNHWLRDSIGPWMMRLTWRNAYSIHFSERQPGTIEMNEASGRPLPSTEIVTDVKSYPLGSATPDSVLRTYVELGFFEPVAADTTSGELPGYDRHYCVVVNRRAFSTADRWVKTNIAGTDSVQLVSDARYNTLLELAETRRIALKLNVEHPADSTERYTWYRVREIAPDTRSLPGSTTLRHVLDTIVHGRDSVVYVTLRPGGSTLLEMTPIRPDSTIYIGSLAYNSQRKILWDGLRYHCVYVAYDTGTDQSSSVHDTIFYRRSLPVDAANNDILWEPTPAYIVSIDTSNADTTRWARTANRHPSLTLRAPNPISEDSTVYVTVVWTCAPAQGYFALDSTLREVCQRTFRVEETLAYLDESGIETINHYHGSVANAWGTPVVCRLDGAYAFAWSDSVDGIVAKLKRVSDTAQWWLARRYYDWSNLEMVSSGLQSCEKPSMFPSMPPFAHITGRDSSISIVWQRTTCNNKNTIMFKRLWHIETGDSAPTLSSNNVYNFCVPPGKFFHPSIDLWQDVWTNLYEGVTWEESVSPDATTAGRTIIHFQPMHTSLYRCFDTSCATGTTLWDSMSAPSIPWTGLAFDANMEPLITHEADSAWPSIAALNEVVDLETQSDTGRFAIAFFDWTSNSDPRLRVAKILYGEHSLVPGYSQTFPYAGYRPQAVASFRRQPLNSGILYETGNYQQGNPPASAPLRTNRQFFGKSRPVGYMAHGRRANLAVNDTAGVGITVSFLDVWYTDDDAGRGVGMNDRGPIWSTIDSLGGMQSIMRTTCFTTHDSVTIGCDVAGTFTGDTSFAPGARLDCVVELIDSTSGNVVAQLDSFTISGDSPSYASVLEPTLDLLSGTYYVRMRLTPTAITPPAVTVGSRYPVIERYRWIQDVHTMTKRARRLEARGGDKARITSYPNPIEGVGELRFSLPTDGYIQIRLIDASGRVRQSILDRRYMREGRYAVAFDAGSLRPGVYLAELAIDGKRLVEKVVVR